MSYNLSEALEKYKNTFCCVGSGSAFFLIGVPAKMDADVLSVMDEYYFRILDNHVRSLLASKKRSQNLLKKKKRELEQNLGEKELEEECESLEDNIRKVSLDLIPAQEELEAFTPLASRRVIEICDKISSPRGKNIIVRGNEQGLFWVKEEFDKKYPKIRKGVEAHREEQLRERGKWIMR